MGTFLTIFVPQQCDYGVCKIYDNVLRNSIFHIVANTWNTFTFFVVCHLYWIELKRENWAIEYLEIDEDILAQFKYSVTASQGDYEAKYDIELPTSINPFSESFDDILVGWTLSLDLVVDSPLNRCLAPYKDFE